MNPIEFLLTVAASPVAYLLLAVLLIVDGFFPFVPGETAVVALATLSASGNGAPVWIVLVVAVIASTVGDSIAFFNGRRLGTSRWAWMRRPRVARMFRWAEHGLSRRPALFLVSAKFVPVARVAVTMTAGASPLPTRRYLPLAFVASGVYTAYHVTVAVFAGSLLSANPLLATGAAIVTVILLGAAIELPSRAMAGRRARARARAAGPVVEPESLPLTHR